MIIELWFVRNLNKNNQKHCFQIDNFYLKKKIIDLNRDLNQTTLDVCM